MRRRFAADIIVLPIAAAFIAFFIVMIPQGWGMDEQSHVARAYQVSEGTLAPYVRADGRTLGAQVPQSIVDLQMDGHRASNDVDRGAPQWSRADFENAGDIARLASAPLRPESTVDFDISNAAASSAVAYAPAAVGMAVGRAAGLDTGGVLLAARISNALFSMALTWIAVRILRGFRAAWLSFVVVLFPSAIVQASYVTADTYTNAVAILVVSAAVRLCLDRDPSARALLVAGVAGLGLAFAKPSYAVFLALVLVIPGPRLLPERWRSRSMRDDVRRARAIRWGYLAIAAVLTAVILVATSSAASAISAMYGRGAVPAEQLKWVLAHPLDAAMVVGRSFVRYGDDWVRNLFGSIGYNGINLPEIAAVVLVAVIVVAALNAEPLRRGRGVWFAIVGAGGVLVSMLALYLSFTPVGGAAVEGVQGRYFAPMVLPVLVGMRSLLPMRAEMSARASAVVFPVGSVFVLAALAAAWILALY
ncbi:DUF2142 domain-containing protein [Microbacterium sp. bgisy203]|uniref:DUF2142 domain-containing protein n=1 Tax=Microbacterium sp. bgisy203 TaxID=3413799 RepID=UPI003D74E2DA